MPSLASLHLYPVKGCAGLSLPEATLGAAGLEHEGAGDREWMIVDADTGRFETQRSLPALACLRPTLEPGALLLHATGAPALRVHTRGASARTVRSVAVWRHAGPAFDEGDEAARWLSDRLGRSLRLVRWDPAVPRVADPLWTGDTTAPVRFADGFPLLVAGSASLAQANRWLEASGRRPLPMNRFRPNLVIDGLQPFEEDRLAAITCGAARIAPVKPCTRCAVPSIDQSTGERGPDPLDVLEAHRLDRQVGGITFGMNAIVASGVGERLSAGAAVSVYSLCPPPIRSVL